MPNEWEWSAEPQKKEDLITYGFKRVTEHLRDILEEIRKEDSRHKEQTAALAEISYKLGVIESYVISLNNCILELTEKEKKICEDLEKIQSNTFLSATRAPWSKDA